VSIDRPPVPATTLEPMSKKFIVRPCADDKRKDKNIVIGDPCTSNMSHRVVTRNALDKRKTGGAGGQARSDTRSRSPILRTPDGLGTKVGQSETGANNSAMMARRSVDGRSSNLRPSDHNIPKQVLGSKTLLRRLDDSVGLTLLLISCLPNI
jgi:hypothetical protein